MKWGDFVLIGVTLAVCLLLWGKLAIGFLQDGGTVEIVAAGEVMLRYDLADGKKTYEAADKNGWTGSFTEEKQMDGSTLIHLDSQGVHLAILFQDGSVRFSESTCPDQVCVQTGQMSKPGQTAACIPAGVLVRVTGDNVSDGADVIIG
jgi:hypothetical protein